MKFAYLILKKELKHQIRVYAELKEHYTTSEDFHGMKKVLYGAIESTKVNIHSLKQAMKLIRRNNDTQR